MGETKWYCNNLLKTFYLFLHRFASMAPIKHANVAAAPGTFRTLLRAAAVFATSLVFVVMIGTYPAVRQRTDKLRITALLTWEPAPLTGAQAQAPAPAPTAGGEASYQFVHYFGEGSTLETRTCGKIQDLRAKNRRQKLVRVFW